MSEDELTKCLMKPIWTVRHAVNTGKQNLTIKTGIKFQTLCHTPEEIKSFLPTHNAHGMMTSESHLTIKIILK